MAGKTRPSLRTKTLQNVDHSNLSITDKECIHQVFERFEKLTTADVVEVVRCKDCEHWKFWCTDPIIEMDYGHCICPEYEVKDTTSDDFCSCGKRKGDLNDNT